MSEAVSPGQLLPVAGDSVQEEEHVARAGHTVTDAGALPQQSPLPAEVSCPPERMTGTINDDGWCYFVSSPEGRHVPLVPPDQVGPGQEVDSPRGAVTPVHQLLLRPPGPDTE